MKVKKGIVLYEIEMNGCLNGVYTNERAGPNGGEIFNEIARLPQAPNDWPCDLSGTYDCFYFDLANERGNGTLQITSTGNIHRLMWRNMHGVPLFEGDGYCMNARQLAVRYQSV
jgi:hypothetical protein